MYLIVWKYAILPEARATFEREYGKEGSWNSLFSESRHFKGSDLYKSEEEPDSYLLIDHWTDQKLYEDFKKVNAGRYSRLSAGFEKLYVTEEKVFNGTVVENGH